MKNITLLLFTLCVSYCSFAQFPEDFQGSTSLPTGWTSFPGANGLGTTQNWEILGTTNQFAAIVWEAVAAGQTAEDWLVTPQFTVDPVSFILSFDQSDNFAADYGSIYTIRVSTQSQTTIADFTIVDTQTEADTWSGGPLAQHTVDLSAYIGQPIYVAFVMENNDGDAWLIDNVNMIADATAPNPVTTPNPADMAIDIAIDPTDGDNAVAFAWTPATSGDAATAYDFYLGDSETTLNLLGTLGNTSVNITGMEYSTVYFWQIVAKNVGGEAVGSSIWSFTTEADPLSVDEFDQELFSYFYNNKTEVLNLESSSNAFSKIEIYSIFGSYVLEKELSNVTETIDVSKLSPGTYIAKVARGSDKQSIKFIKN
jgi:hypothetical protein